MAVYKLFPYKDATLYSLYPEMNTGIDPITSITNLNIAIDSRERFPFKNDRKKKIYKNFYN